MFERFGETRRTGIIHDVALWHTASGFAPARIDRTLIEG